MSYAQKRDSAGRFDAILAYLEGRTHGMRVLDFGCLDGYFANRFADLGAEVVAVDDSDMFDPSKMHANVTPVAAHLEPVDIKTWGHFDVVLALSVLHHLPSWRKYLTALKKSGDILFIETANPDETLPRAKAHAMSDRIVTAVSKLGESIKQTPGYDAGSLRDLWVIDQRK